MDLAYHYGDPARLYLNVTNRCTNRCSFCVRQHARGLGDARDLRGTTEPDLETLLQAVRQRQGSGRWREIVWCGFGEPTFRLDLIVAAALPLRAMAGSIRLNTNGHGCLIHRRDVLPDLGPAIDAVNVSLNAPTAARYAELCHPLPAGAWEAGSPLDGPAAARSGQESREAWEGMLDFLARAPHHIRAVQASVVGAVLTAAEIEACRALARERGVRQFRVR